MQKFWIALNWRQNCLKMPIFRVRNLEFGDQRNLEAER